MAIFKGGLIHQFNRSDDLLASQLGHLTEEGGGVTLQDGGIPVIRGGVELGEAI
jgi:hypothetical protein